jgi:hypothetical protein
MEIPFLNLLFKWKENRIMGDAEIPAYCRTCVYSTNPEIGGEPGCPYGPNKPADPENQCESYEPIP